MDNITILEVDGKEFVIIDRGNEEFTSMLKSEYDRQQAEQSTLLLNAVGIDKVE
jgi:hypothetical protein